MAKSTRLTLLALALTMFALVATVGLFFINTLIAQAHFENTARFAAAIFAERDFLKGNFRVLAEVETDSANQPTGRTIDGLPEWGWFSVEQETFIFVFPKRDPFVESYNKAMRRLMNRKESDFNKTPNEESKGA